MTRLFLQINIDFKMFDWSLVSTFTAPYKTDEISYQYVCSHILLYCNTIKGNMQYDINLCCSPLICCYQLYQPNINNSLNKAPDLWTKTRQVFIFYTYSNTLAYNHNRFLLENASFQGNTVNIIILYVNFNFRT